MGNQLPANNKSQLKSNLTAGVDPLAQGENKIRTKDQQNEFFGRS